MSLYESIKLKEVEQPNTTASLIPVLLTKDTMNQRFQKILAIMKKESLDAMTIYCDLEHGSNFEYLTGFLTRFEEGLLIIHANGKCYLLLGNENLNKATYSRVKVEAIHVPFFSLPNQPMDHDGLLPEYLMKAGLTKGMNVGVVGWKYFTSQYYNNQKLFDIPYYLIDALQEVIGMDHLSNRTDLLIGAKCGVRTTNNANEIAHYEFGSVLASQAMLSAINCLEVGMSEMQLGQELNRFGQPHSVVTIAATGNRFENANLYPTDKKVKRQDKISLTVGYKGGLSSVAGYAVKNAQELPNEVNDYLNALAIPYYAAIITWLENIHVGMKGDELYQLIEEAMPQSKYHWHLNPGHLIGDEEWMSSPIYKGSQEILKSGMMLQTDIIPSRNNYGGVSCESSIVLANQELRYQIQKEYPEMYQRFMKRREYMIHVLGIQLHEDVLPMNDTVAYYRPFLLNKKAILVKEKQH